MRQIFTVREYQAFKATLRDAIHVRTLTKTAAAEVLGITRQMLHLYLNDSEHQPRRRVLERACRAWDISFIAQGKRFDKNAFGPDQGPMVSHRVPVQLLLLPEAIERLDNANLAVKIVRKEAGRICLELDVKFCA